MSQIDAERKEVKERIRRLEEQKAALETKLLRYPRHEERPTSEQLQLTGEYEAVGRELARLVEIYENLLLESSEGILVSLAEDSKRIKWLTVWLVVLTAVLSLGTILDVLARLGLIK